MKEGIYRNKLEEYHGWNFALNIAASGFDNLGLSLVGYRTVLPAFLTLFTKSNFLIGLLPALFVFFWTFPQIVSPLYTGHLRKKKKTIVFVRIGYALPWLIFSMLILFFIKPYSQFSLPIFFVVIILFALLSGLIMPLWLSFVSKLIFPAVRGRFFALRLFVAASLGILASFIVKDLLAQYRYPLNFSLIFFSAFLMFLLGALFLGVSKEPLTPYRVKRKSFCAYFSELGNTLRSDKNLRFFIISHLIRCFGVSIMAAAFYTVYAIRELDVPLSQAGTFMGIMLSGQLFGSMILGYSGSLRGSKRIQILSRLFEVASISAILLQPGIIGIYLAFGFLGLATASMLISYHNMIIELAPREEVDKYMGLVNGIRAPMLAAAPLVGGFLADSVSYRFIFVIALLGSLISGLVLFIKVK